MIMEDRVLVSRILAGDKKAFIVLIEANEKLVSHMVGRIINIREDHEELCQDVFLKVHLKLSEFNFQSKLSTWIATIAYRLSINHLQKKQIPMESDIDDEKVKERFIEHLNPEEIQSEESRNELLRKMIEFLPVHYKSVLTLYHLEELNYQEIQQVLDLPEGTVKNYLFRARKLLKEILDANFVKEELL